jgi:hypothetical protein
MVVQQHLPGATEEYHEAVMAANLRAKIWTQDFKECKT